MFMCMECVISVCVRVRCCRYIELQSQAFQETINANPKYGDPSNDERWDWLSKALSRMEHDHCCYLPPTSSRSTRVLDSGG